MNRIMKSRTFFLVLAIFFIDFLLRLFVPSGSGFESAVFFVGLMFIPLIGVLAILADMTDISRSEDENDAVTSANTNNFSNKEKSE